MPSRTLNTSKWAPENSFEELKREFMKIDPVYFAEAYLTLDGNPMKLIGNGWKFIADIYRYIMSKAVSPDGKPVVIVKGRQVGATSMASALELHMVAGGMFGQGGARPIRVMHAFPQLELMHAFSKDKLEKMVRESTMVPDPDDPRHQLRPFVETMKDTAREAGDSLTYKQFKHGNTLWCDSIGNEGVRVRGRTIDAIFFDEAQLMTKTAIETATKCTTRAQYGPQPGGIQGYFGTPEHKNSYFYEMWENSDQRRYYLGSADCHRYFLLYTPGKSYWTFTITVHIPSVGKVRIVVSYENAELTGTYVTLVTNRVDWSAQKIIATYLLRWPIETFYQDGKEHLGLDEYRMRDAKAIGKHWCLVFTAYSLLHQDCLPSSLEKGQLPIKTIGEACRQQGQALIQKLIGYVNVQLQQGRSMQDIFSYLFAKQQAALPS